MSYNKDFLSLLDMYNQARGSEYDADQFAALVYTFPSILVAHADGTIDPDERNYLKHIPTELTRNFSLAGSEGAPNFNEDYFTEIDFIISNLDNWRSPFLDALKAQLHGSQNEKNTIFQLMWRTADSSEDISESERQEIVDISQHLKL